MSSWIYQALALVASSVMIPAGAYAFKRLFARLDKQDSSLIGIANDSIVIKTVLMGPTGSNGLRGDMVIVKDAIIDLTSRLDRGGVPQ